MNMGRSADYTIQGFLYQFNKTLLELLKSSDNDVVTVEGIIEDIEIVTPAITKAIQCKYHETQTKFAVSSLYKPLLQMMQHFLLNKAGKIEYQLFVHFPNTLNIEITAANLQNAISSSDKTLKSYVKGLKGNIDLAAFLKVLRVDVGPAFRTLATEVSAMLQMSGISAPDVEILAYPNAIQIIADLSIQHNAKNRQITKLQLLERLRRIKSTAISHWTLALQSKDKLLLSRRKQLKTNLAKNARSRFFVLYAESLQDFDQQIVLFIKGYLDKFHFKAAHVSTPIFFLSVDQERFDAIAVRLVHKEVAINDGRVAGTFNQALFLRDPMVIKEKREFLLRLARWETHQHLLATLKADDLFLLGQCEIGHLNTDDINVEKLASESFVEINYMMGLSDVNK